MLGKSIPNVQKAIARQSKKTKKMSIGSTATKLSRTKTRLSPIPSLPLINLKPRPPKNVKKNDEKPFQPLELMSPK